MRIMIIVGLFLASTMVCNAEAIDYSTTTIKRLVMERFGTTSPMVAVAYCESTFRHFDSKGDVLRGRAVPDDRGVFQINLRYHLSDSLRLGYDVGTLDGNIGYAEYLYKRSGLQPWSASKACIEKKMVLWENS